MSSRSSVVLMSPTSMKANEGERVRCTSTLLFGIEVPLHDSGKGLRTGHTVSRAWLLRSWPTTASDPRPISLMPLGEA
jgi:hypothetical protein